jgi:hypothetical protein
MGAPHKYKPEFADMLLAHMSQGLSFEAFGAIAQVTYTTLHAWLRTFPEFDDAKNRGELMSLHFWEKTGIAGIHGKIQGFSSASYCFMMKAKFKKFGYRDDAYLVKNGQVDEEELFKSKLSEMTDSELAQLGEKALHFLKSNGTGSPSDASKLPN